VLQQCSSAIDVENLQAITNSEDGLAQAVGLRKKQFIHGIAARVSWGSVRIFCRAVFPRIYIGRTSGQHHGIASLDQPFEFRGGLVEWDADCFSSRHLDGVDVLGQRPLGVVGIFGMRDGNGDARDHHPIVM